MVHKALGRDIEPIKLMSNHPRILWGVTQLTQSINESKLLDTKLKTLVYLRVASVAGCPF
jgi:hypothetical protein